MLEWIAAASAGAAGWAIGRYVQPSADNRALPAEDGHALARARAEEMQELVRENRALRMLVVPPQVDALRAGDKGRGESRSGLRDALHREVLSQRQTRVAGFLDASCLPVFGATPSEAGAVGVAAHQTVGTRWMEIQVSNALGQTWMVLPLQGALQGDLMVLQTQGVRPAESLAQRLHLMAGASMGHVTGPSPSMPVPAPADLGPALAELWKSLDLRGLVLFEDNRAQLEHGERDTRSISRRLLALALAWPSGFQHLTWLGVRDAQGLSHGLVHVQHGTTSHWLYLATVQPIGSVAPRAEAALKVHHRSPRPLRATTRRTSASPTVGSELRTVGVAS